MDDPKIQILSEHVINKIAAGEVIDRPSSVVKELIENSIDADADCITVILKDGGKTLIQVIDNGLGMSEQDAIMSFQRHATSKIHNFQDVERVTSLGFRGEALASIASVSRVEMKTVQRDDIEGTQINIDAGAVSNIASVGGNAGTSVAVKNIFFNTPARRKFLRATATEYRHILGVLSRFTLAHPHIEFTLFHDDKQIYSLKKTDAQHRIAEVLGKHVGENLLPISEENVVFKVTGFLGNYEIVRKSRGEQYFYVNSRFIYDRTLSAAVVSGYGELLPKGRFPIYILFFEIDPERIDVNVHPTKSEIKFADQHMLFSLVRGAVKRALMSDQIVPDIKPEDLKSFPRKRSRFRASLIDELKNFNSQQATLDFDAPPAAIYASPQDSASQADNEWNDSAVTSSRSQGGRQESERSLMWQLHNKYILSQIKSGLVVIDQHAAHERITYEKVKKRMQKKEAPSQQLLFPLTLELSAEDHAMLLDILSLLENIGFILKGFGGRTVVVEGIPAGMRIRNEERILPEILDEYKLKIGTEIDMQERVAKSVACRASIMSGDRLTSDEMHALVDQLFACETPYFCPHGRPTMITFSLDEFDDRFART
ncbi:DNA mismatch repair endonuclease MutL [candidate division KSB1 bacterium]|nr:DNA mismatch repair endonuclease MutL [candidate division KSB1 bacterium]RQW05107.1 MAG: DNA mismatch repair endonuclease MutL [candidate division KSB1 bacterium]